MGEPSSTFSLLAASGHSSNFDLRLVCSLYSSSRRYQARGIDDDPRKAPKPAPHSLEPMFGFDYLQTYQAIRGVSMLDPARSIMASNASLPEGDITNTSKPTRGRPQKRLSSSIQRAAPPKLSVRMPLTPTTKTSNMKERKHRQYMKKRDADAEMDKILRIMMTYKRMIRSGSWYPSFGGCRAL